MPWGLWTPQKLFIKEGLLSFYHGYHVHQRLSAAFLRVPSCKFAAYISLAGYQRL
jgi:hypothetical protein